MHINGYFDVTSDRKQLLSMTEDDKGPRSNHWNEALMEDALVNAFIGLLQDLSVKATTSYIYHSLWPVQCASFMEPFQRSFFRQIVEEDLRVFKGETKWTAFHDIVFLSPNIRAGINIGQTAYDTLRNFTARHGKTLVEMPSNVLSLLLECNEKSVVKQAIIQEEEMLMIFLKNIHNPLWNTRKESRDEMIVYALQSDSEKIKNMMIERACIPTEPKGTLRIPRELVHPSCDITGMFLDSDGRFPANDERFKSKQIQDSLADLGMSKTLLPKALLVERCESILKIADCCCDCANERCMKILNYLSAFDVQSHLDIETVAIIKSTYMLPVLAHPKTWVFSWKSDSSSSLKYFEKTDICKYHPKPICDFLVLGKPEQLFRQNGSDYLGCVESLVDETGYIKQPDNVFCLLGVQGNTLTDTPVERIYEQICQVSDEYIDKTKQFDEITRIYREIFNHLVSRLNEDAGCVETLGSLYEKPVILIGKDLVTPCKVAYNVKEECAPYLNRLPKTEQLSKRKPLYDAMGIRENFSTSDIIEVLKIKKQRWNDIQCEELDIICNLLTNLQESMSIEIKEYADFINERQSIIGLDRHGILMPTFELVIDDEEYETSLNMHILHECIAPKLGKSLGVKTKDRKCLEEISDGIPFGQKEKLVNRLNKLLKAYPCDSSIMKELLQNADDAYATEIHFIKDYRTHRTPKTLISDKLQGPALCVFNNSYFKAEDFQGIHNLGVGSKTDDPTKTGLYGVGFNAVYHLTDTPTFLTRGPGLEHGGALCIFDPLCTHIPNVKEQEPGIKYTIDGLRKNFPDILSGFVDIERLCKFDIGTIFRLPLRTEQSALGRDEISTETMDELLLKLKDDMFEVLLFVKNVNSIKISDITSGELVEEYSVCVVLSDGDREIRQHFFKEINDIAESNKHNKIANLKVKPVEARYEMTVEDNQGKRKKWYVVQRFGFGPNENWPDIITEKFQNEDLGQLPMGGIAMELSNFCFDNIQKYDGANSKSRSLHQIHETQHEKPSGKQQCNSSGKAFCFLPLPIQTGLPIHVNGHFVLNHECRTELGKGDYITSWNECIMKYIIVPSYVTAMNYLKESHIEKHVDSVTKWYDIHSLMAGYHAIFPSWENAKSDFWRDAVHHIYEYIIEMEIPVFPVIQSKPIVIEEATKEVFELSWTSITCSSGKFKGVFDDILTHLPRGQSRDKYRPKANLLADILKNLGMELILTPKRVYRTLHSAGFKRIQAANPSFVITFLKSFEENCIDRCHIGTINTRLEETHIENVLNLQALVEYIMLADEYQSHMDGLPILLTADGILRKCSTENPIYHSRHLSLLPNSISKFLHQDLLELFDKPVLYKKDVVSIVRKFQISDFVVLLPDSLDPEKFASGSTIAWNKDEGLPIHPEWICLLYEFIYEQSLKRSEFTFDLFIDDDKFQGHLKLLKQWSFLPSCQFMGKQWSFLPSCQFMGKQRSFLPSCQQTECKLVPISNICYVLEPSYVYKQKSKIESVINKFKLPVLDISVFCNSVDSFRLETAIEKNLASTGKPYELLECLLHHKMRIVSCHPDSDDGITTLAFFGENLQLLQQKFGRSLSQKLQCLPLFCTQQGSLISLDNKNDILVLPAGIPHEGIEEWASATGVTLLKENERVKSLYDFLKLSTSSHIAVYLEKIVPYIRHLPREFWLQHIIYMRDHLLSSSGVYNKDQEILINLLKEIPFIETSGHERRVKELYCPEHKVFKVMLEDFNFLPRQFCSETWKKLLKDLGLNVKPNDEIMIDLACRIEAVGIQGINDRVRKQSEVVVRHFISKSKKWKNATFDTMKTVKFIVPHVVSNERSNIFNQLDNGSKLMCFDQSVPVSELHERLCWTSANLLPEQVSEMDKDKKELLGINELPHLPVDKVISHCQNVCGAFETQITEQRVNKEFVQKQMEYFYAFLNHHLQQGMMKQRLQHTPIIYLPDHNLLVKASDVVIELTSQAEVKGYLFKAPTLYGQYHKLFVEIGSQTEVTCQHYASVLNTIKGKIQEQAMMPQELEITKTALTNMLCLLKVRQNVTMNISKLYLPDRHTINIDSKDITVSTLVDSKSLTVSNNSHFETRLDGNVDIKYLIGFQDLIVSQDLDLSLSEPDTAFANLQESLRPALLTEVVTEHVCEDDMVVMEFCPKASCIENFLHSEDFIEGVVRLVKHYFRLSPSNIDENTLTVIASRIQNVKILRVCGLKTVLKYRKEIVKGSEYAKQCFITKQNDGNASYTLYFQETEELQVTDINNLMDDDDGLIDLIQKCADNLIKSERHLASILKMIVTPSKIADKLDILKIGSYTLSLAFSRISVFPNPGTYVEAMFYPFLEHGISTFQPEEYKFVALELEDENMDVEMEADSDSSQEPRYIYVRILREVDCHDKPSYFKQNYVVDTGGMMPEQVPIYRLFRFVRKEAVKGTTLVKYDEEPIATIPFDENCRRIREMLEEAWEFPEIERRRVLKRLLFKWHPDKNIANKEYSSMVFNYIHAVVLTLENGELDEETGSSEVGRTCPDTSRSLYHQLNRNLNQRVQTYTRAFHDNYDDYNRSQRSGNYSHNTARTEVRPDHNEAKRWLRQAKNDYRAAEESLPAVKDANGFNWVCYMCHQACEKSIKAVRFSKDGNSALRLSHSLREIAVGLPDEFKQQATLIENRLGGYSRTRYPDSVSSPKIPSDLFESGDADFCLTVTKAIIEMTDEYIQ